MAYTICTNDWNMRSDYPRCRSGITFSENPDTAANLLLCDQQFEIVSDYLLCYGTMTQVTYASLQNFTDYYQFQQSTATQDRGWILPDQASFTTQTVQEFIDSQSNNNNGANYTGLTAQEYSQLMTLALPVLVLAFSFGFLYRMIMNR